jgi:hypothetical protein
MVTEQQLNTGEKQYSAPCRNLAGNLILLSILFSRFSKFRAQSKSLKLAPLDRNHKLSLFEFVVEGQLSG